AFVPNVVGSRLAGTTAAGGLFYDWELEVPLVNLKGINRMSFSAPPVPGAARSIEIEGVSGDIRAGLWRWDFLPASRGRTLLAYHGYADLAHASWFLRKLIQHNRTLEHGAFLAAGIVFVKAVKLRAESLAGRSSGQRPRIDEAVERVITLRPV